METELQGATKQLIFSPEFGKNETGDYAIVNLSASQTLFLNHQKMTVKLGTENIFDAYYSPFSDWNNIPGRGRNLFVNLSYAIQ